MAGGGGGGRGALCADRQIEMQLFTFACLNFLLDISCQPNNILFDSRIKNKR